LPYINEDCWNIQKERLLRFLQGPRRYLKQYAFKYYCCEFLAFGALVFNMHLMNSVFNNFWVEYYPAIEAFVMQDMKSFAKHSSILFPSQAKCDYYNFGSSGSIQKIDR
jgi:innexin